MSTETGVAQAVRSGGLIVPLICLIAVSLSPTPALAQDDPGSAAFERAACGMCHGSEGVGNSLGPALVPMTYDLDALTAIVRQGIGHMPAMPRSEVSDADLAQLHAYLVRLGDARRTGASPGQAAGGRGVADEDFRARLNRARRANDLDALQAIAAEAGRASLANDLAVAAATWEQVTQSAPPPLDSAGRVDDAIARVERVLGAQESIAATGAERAVAHAFLAALSALRLSLNGTPDDRLAATIERELGHARRLAPDGPRVLFLAGAAAALAPDAAGGPEAAERQLRRAQELFSSSAPADAWPAWNAADAAAWLGRVLFAQGDTVGARRAYQRALQLDPGFLWITRVLLPALAR